MLAFYENKSEEYSVFESHNLNFPSHLHFALELLFLSEGQIEVTVGGQVRVLSAGEMAVIFPNQIHNYRHIPDSLPSRSVLLICTPQICAKVQGMLKTQKPAIPFLRAEQVHSDIAYTLRELLALKASPQDELLSSALIQLLVARLFPCLSLVKQDRSDAENLIGEAIRYIFEHYRTPITLDALSAHLNVSKYHLSRLFSASMSMGFCGYVNYLRVNYAKELLKNTLTPVLSIALDSGFDSLRTFNRAFKTIAGITPKQYRLLGGRL